MARVPILAGNWKMHKTRAEAADLANALAAAVGSYQQADVVLCPPVTSLESVGNATKVTWTSTMRVRVPVIGGLLTRILAGKIGQAFGSMLKETERRLAA